MKIIDDKILENILRGSHTTPEDITVLQRTAEPGGCFSVVFKENDSPTLYRVWGIYSGTLDEFSDVEYSEVEKKSETKVVYHFVHN